ncbi:MAG: pyridoxamine 5'-phosphate oxidase [Planctomycetes bacterium]|nr:pyridoxamine 5'-phosphate oxidase [Planctomycetota bacterium]
MAVQPLARFHRWFSAARRAGVPLHDAMALATADRRGRPSVRFVLLKEAGANGFVFYTNARSRKGRELRDNPRAALVFYWDALGRQVRVEGPVREVTPGEADAYWRTRPRESQIGAIASTQSAPLRDRAGLMDRFRRVRRMYRGQPIPRPPHWTGYRILPRTMEFWTRGPHRLHDREEFVRSGAGWRRRRLQP